MRTDTTVAKTRTAMALLALSTLMGVSAPAAAAPITWNLVDVTFEDEGTATGSFVFDADTSTFSDITIVTSDNDALGLGSTYGVSTGIGSNVFFDTVVAFPLIGTHRLLFDLVSPMTNAGGTIGIALGAGIPDAEGVCTNVDCSFLQPFRSIVAGSIQSERETVPEPASLVLVGVGLAALAARAPSVTRPTS